MHESIKQPTRQLRRFGLAAAALLVLAGWYLLRVPALPAAAVVGGDSYTADEIQRGEYLLTVAGCANCHTDTDNDGAALAGGLRLETPFGSFHTPNITADPNTGIGDWTLTDFVRSMRLGVGADGRRHYPAFPYPSYSGMTPQDLRAMFAYLRSVPAVSKQVPPHDLPWYLPRAALAVWQRLYFEPHEFTVEPDRDARWNRGAYLVRVLGHCGECHSPRNRFGAVDPNRFLAGTARGPDDEPVPNISPSRESGIGKWSRSALDYFLETGMLPDGDFTGGAMGEVIDNSLTVLTTEDRDAIVEFLRSVPAHD